MRSLRLPSGKDGRFAPVGMLVIGGCVLFAPRRFFDGFKRSALYSEVNGAGFDCRSRTARSVEGVKPI